MKDPKDCDHKNANNRATGRAVGAIAPNAPIPPASIASDLIDCPDCGGTFRWEDDRLVPVK